MVTNEIYLSDKQLAERYSTDRATIWAWVRTNDFPAPVKLAQQTTRWKLREVEQWEKERKRLA
ncbi:MAG: AlpA family phage regulatory protein [Roseitalea porphyridii]|jgi:prophage regulatory protein|uniref:helix-turn-helix transcriptional regulator n=1 Tax=Roseitalea porphyridii TaxID=1852022 RepID=UPI0032EDD0E8